MSTEPAMADPIITLTTDFGEADPYVAAMKGVILELNPAARLVDLSHAIPPQDLVHAAIFLVEAVPYFPAGTLHVVVVDPGVGTDRKLLYLELGEQRLLVPDNGIVSLLEQRLPPRRAFILSESRYWRSSVSRTFHGRDILAPVAGHLSRGLDPSQLGPATSTFQRLPLPVSRKEGNRIQGEIIHVDYYGNLISNIPGEQLAGRHVSRIAIGEQAARLVETYGQGGDGELVALISSSGLLEIAVPGGSAAQRLGASRGTPVTVELNPDRIV
jgi:S-adenosyl-L-methionine hydrolase (adenosine-forming)